MVGDDDVELGLVDLEEALQGFDLVLAHTLLPLADDDFGGEQRATAEVDVEELGDGMGVEGGGCGGQDEQMSPVAIGFHELLHTHIEVGHLVFDKVVEMALSRHEGGGAFEKLLLHVAVADETQLAEHDPPQDAQADAELEAVQRGTTTVAEVVAEGVGAQQGAVEVDGEGFAHIVQKQLFSYQEFEN